MIAGAFVNDHVLIVGGRHTAKGITMRERAPGKLHMMSTLQRTALMQVNSWTYSVLSVLYKRPIDNQ